MRRQFEDLEGGAVGRRVRGRAGVEPHGRRPRNSRPRQEKGQEGPYEDGPRREEIQGKTAPFEALDESRAGLKADGVNEEDEPELLAEFQDIREGGESEAGQEDSGAAGFLARPPLLR